MTGFVAGTLVHTDKGLVPIQEIKVGDIVLSRPEWGGKDALIDYKCVTRAFCSGEELIYRLVLWDSDVEYIQGAKLKVKVLFVSENHLIWVESDKDWVPTYMLDACNGEALFSYNFNKLFATVSVYPVLKVDKYHINSNKESLIDLSKVGFCCVDKQRETDMIILNRIEGIQVFSDSCWQNYYDFSYEYSVIPRKDIDYLNSLDLSSNGILSANVYNLEVQDFHTYFIGEDGIWVHQ